MSLLWRSFIYLGVLCVATAGCGEAPDTSKVAGKVVYEGNPVPLGTITFYPKARGRRSRGAIDSDGSYELAYLRPGEGAIPGEYEVTIESRRLLNEAEIQQNPLATAKYEWLVPQEYSIRATSGLTATVKDSGNTIDFNLP